MKFSEQLKSGVILDNPVFMQTIGLCPTLATTTSLQNAIGMGAAATVVLICSNVVISALRKIIPDKIRIAASRVSSSTGFPVIGSHSMFPLSTNKKICACFPSQQMETCSPRGRLHP